MNVLPQAVRPVSGLTPIEISEGRAKVQEVNTAPKMTLYRNISKIKGDIAQLERLVMVATAKGVDPSEITSLRTKSTEKKTVLKNLNVNNFVESVDLLKDVQANIATEIPELADIVMLKTEIDNDLNAISFDPDFIKELADPMLDSVTMLKAIQAKSGKEMMKVIGGLLLNGLVDENHAQLENVLQKAEKESTRKEADETKTIEALKKNMLEGILNPKVNKKKVSKWNIPFRKTGIAIESFDGLPAVAQQEVLEDVLQKLVDADSRGEKVDTSIFNPAKFFTEYYKLGTLKINTLNIRNFVDSSTTGSSIGTIKDAGIKKVFEFFESKL